jgi:hypothetical protein
MKDAKYIGPDVHQATISVAVFDSTGKLVMEAILEIKAERRFSVSRGLRGRALEVVGASGFEPVAGELLLRAGVTMLHFVENFPPYQFARDSIRALQ